MLRQSAQRGAGICRINLELPASRALLVIARLQVQVALEDDMLL